MPKLLKNYFSIIFILYLWHPHLFERSLFINEQLSLLGICLFLKEVNIKRLTRIEKNVLFFSSSILFYFISCGLFASNMYILARNSSLFYSVFCFFSVPYIFNYIINSKYKIILFFPVQKVNLIICFALIFIGKFKISIHSYNPIYLYMFFLLLYSLIFGGSTAILAVFFIFIYNLFGVRAVFYCIILLYVFLMTLVSLTHNIYFSGIPFDIYDLMDASAFLSIDGNASVRFLMWGKILFDILPDNIFGVGFGKLRMQLLVNEKN